MLITIIYALLVSSSIQKKKSFYEKQVSYRGIICIENRYPARFSDPCVSVTAPKTIPVDQSSPRICHSSEAVKARYCLYFSSKRNSLNLANSKLLFFCSREIKLFNGSTQSSARAGNRSAGNAEGERDFTILFCQLVLNNK